MQLIKAAQEGIAGIPLEKQAKQTALANVKLWLKDRRFAPYAPAVESLIRRGRFELLVDSFYTMLPFGTGGRRGAVGVGPNRMNPYTVTTSVQGHCLFLKKRFPGEQLRVVLACDVRCFLDLKGLYERETLGDLYGLTSKKLSMMAAQVYTANGVSVHMADPALETYVSTPELSYHIYHLHAHGGLNISASHNHPDDNGAKFYNAAGGQEVPPYDEELVQVASSVKEASSIPFEQAVKDGLIRFLRDEERQGYIDLNVQLSHEPSARQARVAFSSLHGTGLTTAWPVLAGAGFEVVLAEREKAFDGAFPNVPNRLANPEVPAAMGEVIRVAREARCDVAMATDPDADRLGVALPDGAGNWICLTGNQIGALIAWHLLSVARAQGTLRPEHFLLKTEVTTDLLARMAEAFSVRCIGHLLVGFKYIGDVLDQVDRFGKWGDFVAAPRDFLFAMEESHGFLATPAIRDKDAANGALLIAELTSICKERGGLLYDQLLELYRRFGYFGTALKSIVVEGVAGLASIRAIQSSLRADPPTSIGGLRVLEFHDRQDPKGIFGPIKSETDRNSRDVLVFRLEGGIRLTLRPSGTEPKNKSYAEMATPPLGPGATAETIRETMREVDGRLKSLLDLWEKEMLARKNPT
jgi:phosphoglucomutase/phosphomannomutase